MAEAGVPASIADRAAIVAALQVLCALPECARGALNARSTKSGLSLNYSGKRKLQTSIWAACKKSCGKKFFAITFWRRALAIFWGHNQRTQPVQVAVAASSIETNQR